MAFSGGFGFSKKKPPSSSVSSSSSSPYGQSFEGDQASSSSSSINQKTMVASLQSSSYTVLSRSPLINIDESNDTNKNEETPEAVRDSMVVNTMPNGRLMMVNRPTFQLQPNYYKCYLTSEDPCTVNGTSFLTALAANKPWIFNVSSVLPSWKVFEFEKPTEVALEYRSPWSHLTLSEFCLQQAEVHQAQGSSSSSLIVDSLENASFKDIIMDIPENLIKQVFGIQDENNKGYNLLPTHIEVSAYNNGLPVQVDVKLQSKRVKREDKVSLKHVHFDNDPEWKTWCSFRSCNSQQITHMVLPPHTKQDTAKEMFMYCASECLNDEDFPVWVNNRADVLLNLLRSYASTTLLTLNIRVIVIPFPPTDDYTTCGIVQWFVMKYIVKIQANTLEYIKNNRSIIDKTSAMAELNTLKYNTEQEEHSVNQGAPYMKCIYEVLESLIRSFVNTMDRDLHCMNVCQTRLVARVLDWPFLLKMAQMKSEHSNPDTLDAYANFSCGIRIKGQHYEDPDKINKFNNTN
jgi:hypothetical protein